MINCPINLKNNEMRYIAYHISSLLTNEIILHMLDRDDFTSEQRDFIENIGKEYMEQFK